LLKLRLFADPGNQADAMTPEISCARLVRRVDVIDGGYVASLWARGQRANERRRADEDAGPIRGHQAAYVNSAVHAPHGGNVGKDSPLRVLPDGLAHASLDCGSAGLRKANVREFAGPWGTGHERQDGANNSVLHNAPQVVWAILARPLQKTNVERKAVLPSGGTRRRSSLLRLAGDLLVTASSYGVLSSAVRSMVSRNAQSSHSRGNVGCRRGVAVVHDGPGVRDGFRAGVRAFSTYRPSAAAAPAGLCTRYHVSCCVGELRRFLERGWDSGDRRAADLACVSALERGEG